MAKSEEEYSLTSLLRYFATRLPPLAHLGRLLLLWKYRMRQPISYSVMLLGLLLMQLTYSHFSLPRTQSSLRLLSTMVPFLMLLALEAASVPWTKPRRLLAATAVLLVAGICSYLFGAKNFLG